MSSSQNALEDSSGVDPPGYKSGVDPPGYLDQAPREYFSHDEAEEPGCLDNGFFDQEPMIGDEPFLGFDSP